MSDWAVPGYTELRHLGSGGFGAVVLARHDATGTPVAIKYLHASLSDEPEFAALFRAEAQTLSLLDSPYVVRLYEYVEAPEGSAIVMELIEGVSLQEILSRHGVTSPEAALVVLYGSLLGLAAAHTRGLVHRDYKPGNVLVNGYGASKLTDFGLAARAGSRPLPAGTPWYASPEQFDGGPATPAGDVYAATATFYECLAGHPPFTGESAQTVIEQHRSEPVPLAPVPEPLRPLVARGMAKDPRRRPSDGAALAAELRATAAGAYGEDWESRGRSHLGEAALLLAVLWPSAGVPAVQGVTIEQPQLSPAHGHELTRAERHWWHVRHVLHMEHLAHLRSLRRLPGTDPGAAPAGGGSRPGRTARNGQRLRRAAAVVTALAVLAAIVTVFVIRHPTAGHSAARPGLASRAVISVYQIPLAAPLPPTPGVKVTSGSPYVVYDDGNASTTALSGVLNNISVGEVVRLYAQQFPYTSSFSLAGTAPLAPWDGNGGTASYSFQVTPTLATRYQVRLFRSAAATAPVLSSSVATVYVIPYQKLDYGGTLSCTAAGCTDTQPETIYIPPSVLSEEIAKPEYLYYGTRTSVLPPDEYMPPLPKVVQLNNGNLTATKPQRTSDDSFSFTVTAVNIPFKKGVSFEILTCMKSTEAQDGVGLPGSHGCGAESVSTSAPYLG